MSDTNVNKTSLYTMQPLTLFSNRAEDYVKYQPSYLTAAINNIVEGLSDRSFVSLVYRATVYLAEPQLRNSGSPLTPLQIWFLTKRWRLKQVVTDLLPSKVQSSFLL